MDAFCGKASGFSKVSFILLFPALAIQCAGLGTIAWMKIKTASNSVVLQVGLFKIANCSGGYDVTCEESALPSSYETQMLHVTQGLECASLAFIVISLVVSAFYVTSPAVRIQATAVFIMIFCLLAMLFNVGGTVACFFNLPDKHYLYWSMGLTLVAAGFCLLCAVLMIPDIRYYDYEGVERKAAERRERKRRRQEERDTDTLI